MNKRVISGELKELVELMARNVHDEWARTRIQQGWTYGLQRDDERKQHPCLVPYDELPEEEKVFDRNTALATIRFILSQGFTISRTPSAPDTPQIPPAR